MKLNDNFLDRLKFDWRWSHSNSESFYVGSSDSEPPLSDIDFINKMAWVWTTLNSAVPGFSVILKFFWITPKLFYFCWITSQLSISHIPSHLLSGVPWNAKIIESPLDKMINAQLTHVVPQKIYIWTIYKHVSYLVIDKNEIIHFSKVPILYEKMTNFSF